MRYGSASRVKDGQTSIAAMNPTGCRLPPLPGLAYKRWRDFSAKPAENLVNEREMCYTDDVTARQWAVQRMQDQ